MPTLVLDDFRNAQLGNGTHATIDFDTDVIAASLLDATDANGGTALSVSNVIDYDDVDDADVVHAEEALGSLTVGTVGVGIFDAANTVMSAVSGDAADYLTVHLDTGTPSTSPLALVFDSATTGIPVTPNGGNITSTWAGGGILTI